MIQNLFACIDYLHGFVFKGERYCGLKFGGDKNNVKPFPVESHVLGFQRANDGNQAIHLLFIQAAGVDSKWQSSGF